MYWSNFLQHIVGFLLCTFSLTKTPNFPLTTQSFLAWLFGRHLFCNLCTLELVKTLMLVAFIAILESVIGTVIARAKPCPALLWDICLENYTSFSSSLPGIHAPVCLHVDSMKIYTRWKYIFLLQSLLWAPGKIAVVVACSVLCAYHTCISDRLIGVS